MSYWKSKVLPRLKKLLKKVKKNNGLEPCKSFDKSKESIVNEIQEKKEELQPKVVTIYKSSTTETKTLLKEPTETGVTEHSEMVQNLLIELANAGCPGAQYLSDAATKHGPTAISEQIVFLLSKTTVFVAGEEAPAPAAIVREISEATAEEMTKTSKDDEAKEESKAEITTETTSIVEKKEVPSV